MLNLNARGPYAQKDQAKANVANKFIGVGVWGSSTYSYSRTIRKECVNHGHYDPSDVVFVSINGARANRVSVNAIMLELRLATEAGATLITDGAYDRNRSYNVGEREVAAFLLTRGYQPWATDAGYDEWRPVK